MIVLVIIVVVAVVINYIKSLLLMHSISPWDDAERYGSRVAPPLGDLQYRFIDIRVSQSLNSLYIVF